MSSTNTDEAMLLDTGRSGAVWAVAFHPDGKHVFGGNDNGIQRWRLADGQEVGKQTGMKLCSISASKDHQWIVGGTFPKGASVWDGEIHERVIEVEGTVAVDAVDVSPDSTRFATGSRAGEANIWSITTGKRLVGPLKHDHDVDGIRFSPSGDRIATACTMRIRIFDSYTGDELVTIKINLHAWPAMTLLAWSSNGQQIFAVSRENKIKAFHASSGTQLAESQILHVNYDASSIALAANDKFITTFAGHSISFLDTSTLTQIGPVLEVGNRIQSIGISLDSSRLATGRYDGKIIIRDLGKILPDLYGPFNISTRDEIQQPPTSGDHDGRVSSSTPEVPGESSRVAKSKGHGEGDNGDLIEHEVSSTPAQFDYDDQSLSPAPSVNTREDEIPPVGSHPISQSLGFPPVTSPPEVHAVELENVDTVESPRRHSIFRKQLWRKRNRPGGATSPELGQFSGKSRKPADHRSPSHSSTRIDATNEGPSWMAAAQPTPRVAARSFGRRKDKPPSKAAVPKGPNKDTSRSGSGSVGVNETRPPQQESNPSQPSTGTVHVTHQQETGVSTLSISFPTWMWCCRSVTQDETH